MIGTYRIINVINGKCYYGSSINIHKRFIQHKSNLRNNKHHCKSLQNAWNKYTVNGFVFEVIEECCKSQLLLKENTLLQNDNIYNSVKEAYSVSGKNHPMFGRKHSQESINKIKQRRSTQKIIHSDKTKAKMSEKSKGRKMPEGHLKKMIDARNGKAWNKGIKTGISPASKITMNNEEIISLYNSGSSIESIRKEKKVSWDVIKRILSENEVPIRSIKQQKLIRDEQNRKLNR